MTTELFTQQYTILRDYLASYILSEDGSERISTKDKLGRLPADQFFDVSTDLTDEINRRIYKNRDVPFLPVRTVRVF